LISKTNIPYPTTQQAKEKSMSEHPETLKNFLKTITSYVISNERNYHWNNEKSNIGNTFDDHWRIGFSYNRISISREIQGKGMLHKCLDCDLVITRGEKNIRDVLVKSPEYLLSEVIEAYDELNTLIDGKVFSKITGKFVDKDLYDIQQQVVELFGYEDLDECCVCSELTTLKTECRHPLCLECWVKLKKRKNDIQRQCPMCRQDIYSTIECPYHPDIEDGEGRIN